MGLPLVKTVRKRSAGPDTPVAQEAPSLDMAMDMEEQSEQPSDHQPQQDGAAKRSRKLDSQPSDPQEREAQLLAMKRQQENLKKLQESAGALRSQQNPLLTPQKQKGASLLHDLQADMDGNGVEAGN